MSDILQQSLDETVVIAQVEEPEGVELASDIAAVSGIDGLFRVIEGADRLRLGNLLKIDLQRPLQQGLVPIPFQAIYGNNRIYLLKDGRMQGLDVDAVGQYFPADAPPALLIRSPGIQAGDRIIRTHLPNAVTGLKVKVVNS